MFVRVEWPHLLCRLVNGASICRRLLVKELGSMEHGAVRQRYILILKVLGSSREVKPCWKS